jgi:hypothetical protein
MTSCLEEGTPSALERVTLVALANDLAGVQGPDGTLVPSERLGIGLVQAAGPRGDICVHWLDADIDAWVAADDVRPLGADKRIITVRRMDHPGRQPRVQRFLAVLDHHWTVELLPDRVIRVVRADGPCWTFAFNTLTRQVDPPWHTELTDDAAEAIVASDLAMAQTDTSRGLLLAFMHRASEMIPLQRIRAALVHRHN